MRSGWFILLIIYDKPRRHRRGIPAAGRVYVRIFANTALPAVPRRGLEAGDPPEIAWLNDFHGLGENHSWSYPFLYTGL
jgi:hypothetical protein